MSLFAGAAGAQPAAAPAAPAADTIRFSGDELRRFALANLEVERIRSTYSAQMGMAIGNPQKSAAVQQQANEAMVAAVAKSGISMPLYNQIVAVAQVTPQLDAHIKELQTTLEAGQKH